MTTYADILLEFDDLHLGAITVGVPLHDGHGLAEVEPGVLADGRHLEMPVTAMLERQAQFVRAEARFWLRSGLVEPGMTRADLRERANRRVSDGWLAWGHSDQPDSHAWHVAALTRIGQRLRAELQRRLDPTQREAVTRDDIVDFDARHTDERRKLTNKIQRATLRLEQLDAERHEIEEAGAP